MTSPLPWIGNGTVATVGSFDGLHRGHLAVLGAVLERAVEAGRTSLLVTFEPHPARVLHPDAAPPRLTTAEERAEVVAATGLDYMAVLRFDRALANLDSEAFVRTILLRRFGLVGLVMGQNHGFGRGRGGDVSSLPALGKALGFEVAVVPPVADGTEVISSTAIRQALALGRFEDAARGLGRRYSVSGTVVPGARRGTSIGVPTINIAPPPDKLLPPDAVYAVRVEWGGGSRFGMMNQGPRPTLGDPTRWLEAHLFDFQGDLYGRRVRIEWLAKLREIRRFGSLDELKGQLAEDERRARAIAGERLFTSTGTSSSVP